MKRSILYVLFMIFMFATKAQTTNSAQIDSTFRVFPNPVHDQFFITTQGKVYYAMIISSNGSKRTEYFNYEIPGYQNQFGLGCYLAGCPGAYVPSNFICTLQRKNIENGLYFLVLLDDQAHVYHTLIVFN